MAPELQTKPAALSLVVCVASNTPQNGELEAKGKQAATLLPSIIHIAATFEVRVGISRLGREENWGQGERRKAVWEDT